MARVLVVPDVHERLDRLANALRGRIEKADRVVFLGDWFDAFGEVDLRRVGQVCQFINGNVDGLRVPGPCSCAQQEDNHIDDCTWWTDGRVVPATFLLGNHDCHYFFRHDWFKCSGYNPQKQEVISANVPQGIIEHFDIFTRVGPYLVSHAGFHPKTLQYATLEDERDALESAYNGRFDAIFGAGYARGGRQAIGGPTWLDWSAEFEHIDDCPQIVGHTNGRDIRVKGGLAARHNSYCLDTALHHVAFVDDETGTVTIERVE